MNETVRTIINRRSVNKYKKDQITDEELQQILEAGDLNSTVRSVSGFAPEDLKIMQTRRGDTERYDFVWTAAGETGEQICRACILDDGSYHYVLTATADASQGAQVQDVWREMFNSFRLVSPETPLYTGS